LILDENSVSQEDLGAGFFFRDEDVGKNRAEAAKPRIQSLNPLVAVETIASCSSTDLNTLSGLIASVDLVCATDFGRDFLVRVNEVCRQFNKPLYAGGTYGLLGYIFCDLLSHSYLSPDRNQAKDAPPRTIKLTACYPPLSQALSFNWSALSKRQTKEINPATIVTILALWEFEAQNGVLPSDLEHVPQLETWARALITSTRVNTQVLPSPPTDLLRATATTANHEFSPVCAIVGGILAQDILKSLAAREPPIANFFAFDGNTGSGTVCRMHMDQ
jgi:ubiquitin-like 1-activating enzyme E1 A